MQGVWTQQARRIGLGEGPRLSLKFGPWRTQEKFAHRCGLDAPSVAVEEIGGPRRGQSTHAPGIARRARSPAEKGGKAVLGRERAIEIEGYDAGVVSRIVHYSPKIIAACAEIAQSGPKGAIACPIPARSGPEPICNPASPFSLFQGRRRGVTCVNPIQSHLEIRNCAPSGRAGHLTRQDRQGL